MNAFPIGATVHNLGLLAKVVGHHEITGDPILRPLWNDGTRWLASAALCEPVGEPAAPLMHKDGLVANG